MQIIGIDTAYHQNARHAERRLNEWLAIQLERKRTHGTINILLSSNEPYSKKSGDNTELLANDLLPFAHEGLIDLWFWGNEHYCALYRRSDDAPFIGSCIGHGGYPYSRIDREDLSGNLRGHARFVETHARFPDATEVRPDRGNNGFAVLTIEPDSTIGLDYIDWMRDTRFTTRLNKTSQGLDFVA